MKSAAALSTAAAVWTAALIPLAFFAPAYQGESASSAGVTTHTTATLVEINGVWVVWLLCVPLTLAVFAAVALHRGTRAAWLPIGAFCLFAVVGAASIGIWLLPPAALLVASGYRPASRSRSAAP